MKISDAYKYASEIMIENMMNKDSEEGIAAFLEKRTPNWTQFFVFMQINFKKIY